MKFIIIAYSEIDGVGQHVISLNTNLNKMGHESKAILLHKSKKIDKNIILIKRSFFYRGIFFILEFLKKDLKGLFSFGNSTIRFNQIKDYINESDVIIIYALHKILSFNMLKKIFETDKIVYLRPLDMELASGGCHVNVLNTGEECTKFQSGCNDCPLLNSFNIFNLSNKIFKRKKEIIEKYQPKIFLENNFTKSIYDSSPITKKSKTETIFLGVNKERTNLIKKEEARKILKIDHNDKVILFGTFTMDAPHKGGRILESILKGFISNLHLNKTYKTDLSKIKLITFGNRNTFSVDIPEIEWIHLGVIDSNQKLNLLYRSADVFVSPSTGCNGPHVVLEALTNDLPVVAFNQGVAKDSVIDGVNGYLVPCFNKEIFSNSIFKVLFLNELNTKNINHERLKSLFSASSEANLIIKHAHDDLKKNKHR